MQAHYCDWHLIVFAQTLILRFKFAPNTTNNTTSAAPAWLYELNKSINNPSNTIKNWPSQLPI